MYIYLDSSYKGELPPLPARELVLQLRCSKSVSITIKCLFWFKISSFVTDFNPEKGQKGFFLFKTQCTSPRKSHKLVSALEFRLAACTPRVQEFNGKCRVLHAYFMVSIWSLRSLKNRAIGFIELEFMEKNLQRRLLSWSISKIAMIAAIRYGNHSPDVDFSDRCMINGIRKQWIAVWSTIFERVIKNEMKLCSLVPETLMNSCSN